MPHHYPTRLLTALLIAVSIETHAQSLGDPVVPTRVIEVGQFGVPQDAKYIFCDGQDCPDRSTKTLTEPSQAPASPVLLLPNQRVKSVTKVPDQDTQARKPGNATSTERAVKLE